MLGGLPGRLRHLLPERAYLHETLPTALNTGKGPHPQVRCVARASYSPAGLPKNQVWPAGRVTSRTLVDNQSASSLLWPSDSDIAK